MCRVLEVAPAGYYAWCHRRSPCARQIADERLLLNIRRFHEASGGTYGSPRILRDLRDDGRQVGQKRVARLMRQDGLVGRRRRSSVRTTDSTHAYPLAPNRLERQFAVNGMALNRVWVSDITYVPTREGWLYLAVVLDLASRRVVGWAMRETLEAELALSALRMAVTSRRPAPGLIHHSDRGVQYACTAYRELLAAHQIDASMSRAGDCWDNAVAESFFATLELELIDGSKWATRAEARQAIFGFIHTWYNRQRRHSTLQYLSPMQYEQQLQMVA
jgi:putative transposase